MAGDEYTSVGGGGLKLKGVKGGKVNKTRKKKSKKPKELPDETATPPPDGQKTSKDSLVTAEAESGVGEDHQSGVEGDSLASRSTKTPTELRHEERRRKMVCRISHFSPSTGACSYLCIAAYAAKLCPNRHR